MALVQSISLGLGGRVHMACLVDGSSVFAVGLLLLEVIGRWQCRRMYTMMVSLFLILALFGL